MSNTASGFGFDPPPKLPTTQLNKHSRKHFNMNINILYQNVRGLRTKTTQFIYLLESAGFDLFSITESGLNEGIHDAEFVLPGYQILRCDRADGRKQGGVFLVATPRYELRRVPVPIDCNAVPNSHDRQLDLVLSASGSVSVGAADEGLQPVDEYHPPLAVSVDIGARAWSARLPPSPPPTPPPSRAPPAPSALSAPHAHNRSSPTHTSLLHNSQRAQSAINRELLWNFNKADFITMYDLLAKIDWSEMYCLQDQELVINLFYEKLYGVFDMCVPIKKNSLMNNNRYKYPVWYTADLIKDIQIKYKLHKKYKSSKLPHDYMEFARYRARVKAEIARAHDMYRDHVQQHLVREPRAFWGYVRSRRGNTNNRKLIKDGRVLADYECANEFARYFQSVYNPEPPVLSAAAAGASRAAGAARAHLALLRRADVRTALARLPPKRSAGPDGIPAFIFRDCSAVLVDPLLHLYNVFVRTATFPDRWKLTRVVPVPKGSGGTEACDYRPVAVLCTPAKVFESAIHSSLYSQVGPLLSDAQHGFRPGRGTTGNLLDLMTHVVPAVDAGQQVDVAYFDFRKAFDTVDNDILLSKLAGVGCTPHTLTFFSNYLRDRCQYVDCGGSLSEPYFTSTAIALLAAVSGIKLVTDIEE
ncbi:uncharacterized protein LOC111364560 [Spodoptera litura]|uniref:Uncharacterized protein LOC111364560 n=1 Tax=Spodoptera litura TaxID=69820 RepID=A0A9J7J0E5_SPOLT|nr:uncharacterized protein LOC111364560 [Spodoptera litura]